MEKAINVKRQMVDFNFGLGFEDGIKYECDNNLLRENLNIRDILLYASASEDRKWYECHNSNILYALRKSCKGLGLDFTNKYNVYIKVYLMKGMTFPTLSVDFKIVEK